MILRKPYAFFIKMFKPMHLLLAVSVAYLIYLENQILSFLSTYMYSTDNLVGTNIKDRFASNFLFTIPIIVIIVSMIIIGIMVRKRKPVIFYLVNIFSFIVVTVINLYTTNFLGVLEKTIVAIKITKLMHDLTFIAIALESVSFTVLLIRGMGINFKKFDFSSEISKFNISATDKEEFEINVDVDLNESRTNFRRKLRNFKYTYIENRFLIKIVALLALIFIGFIMYLILKPVNYKEEKNVYSVNGFNYIVDETLILNTDYQGNKLTDNYLIVVNTRMNSSLNNKSLYLKDFNLKIGDLMFLPVSNYSKYLTDLGKSYNEDILTNEFNSYLLVFEIPEKYIASDMFLRYSYSGGVFDIKLSPKNLVTEEISIEKTLGEEIDFSSSIGDIKFTINSYDISNKYIINYNYCYTNDDCIKSIEYLKPSINTNFDKYILKLNVNYSDNSNLKINTFYKFLHDFGSIYYKIDGNWNVQNNNFEEIKSSKVSGLNDIYIGIKSDIFKAENIKLVFYIRGNKYEYMLK